MYVKHIIIFNDYLQAMENEQFIFFNHHILTIQQAPDTVTAMLPLSNPAAQDRIVVAHESCLLDRQHQEKEESMKGVCANWDPAGKPAIQNISLLLKTFSIKFIYYYWTTHSRNTFY